MGSGSFPENTAAGAWSWPLTSSNTEVKNGWSNTSTHPTWFKAWIGKTLPLQVLAVTFDPKCHITR
jgi:hypothetical protein